MFPYIILWYIRDSVSKAWNFAIRKVFNINRCESTRMLFFYCNLMSATFVIDCMQLSLYVAFRDSINPVLKACALSLHSDGVFKKIVCKHDVPLYANRIQIKNIVWNKFVNYCEF